MIDIERKYKITNKCKYYAFLHLFQYLFMLSLGLYLIEKYKKYLGGVTFHNIGQAYRMLPLGLGFMLIYYLVLKQLKYFWYVEKAKKQKCGVVLFFLENERLFAAIYNNQKPLFLLAIGIVLILLQFIIDYFVPYGRLF